ncbi:MAG: hypothetical protein HY302_14620 [Opitutae bacterium]|nr:hypothetical protein [Opitutae bacterium]
MALPTERGPLVTGGSALARAPSFDPFSHTPVGILRRFRQTSADAGLALSLRVTTTKNLLNLGEQAFCLTGKYCGIIGVMEK